MTTGDVTFLDRAKRVEESEAIELQNGSSPNGQPQNDSHPNVCPSYGTRQSSKDHDSSEIRKCCKSLKSLKKKKAFVLDFCSRIVFPCAFICFNILFWGVIYIRSAH